MPYSYYIVAGGCYATNYVTTNAEDAYNFCISTPNSIIYDINGNPLMKNL